MLLFPICVVQFEAGSNESMTAQLSTPLLQALRVYDFQRDLVLRLCAACARGTPGSAVFLSHDWRENNTQSSLSPLVFYIKVTQHIIIHPRGLSVDALRHHVVLLLMRSICPLFVLPGSAAEFPRGRNQPYFGLPRGAALDPARRARGRRESAVTHDLPSSHRVALIPAVQIVKKNCIFVCVYLVILGEGVMKSFFFLVFVS